MHPAPEHYRGDDEGDKHRQYHDRSQRNDESERRSGERSGSSRQIGDRSQDTVERSLENDDPVESAKAGNDGGVQIRTGRAGMGGQETVGGGERGALGAERRLLAGSTVHTHVGRLAHDALARMPGNGLGEKQAFAGRDHDTRSRQALGAAIGDALHRRDREHRLQHTERRPIGGIVDADRDVERPHAGRIVVVDGADGNLVAPGREPPALVGLDEVARGIGQRDVVAQPIGEERLGEVGRDRHLLAQIGVGLRKGAKALGNAEAIFEIVGFRVGESRIDMTLVRLARRGDDHVGCGPRLGLVDAFEEKRIELSRNIARLGGEIRSQPLRDDRVAHACEAFDGRVKR